MDAALRIIIGAIITFALAWVILSLLLQWARPRLYNDNGSVNWWTTLWVSLVTMIILWIILLILHYATAGMGAQAGCVPAGCAVPAPCDPCAPQGQFQQQQQYVPQQQQYVAQPVQQFVPQTMQNFQ